MSKSGVVCFSFFNLPPHFREIVRKGCPHDFKGRAKLSQFIVVFAVFLSVTTFSICGSIAEGIRASYPPSGEKYYLTNEQGEQLGDGAYIGTVPVPMSKEDERTIALLEKLPIVATPIYSAFCIIAGLQHFIIAF